MTHIIHWLVIIAGQLMLSKGDTPYPASEYYWPMTATNKTYMKDKEMFGANADLHDIRFIAVRRLEYAAALYGQLQWIDMDAGVMKDCLAFQFSSCNDQSIALAFWIRVRSAKRILATGSYTNSTDGPGILIEYDDETEMLRADFASSERHWTIQLPLRKHSWCHVTTAWTIKNGLHVAIDGDVNIENSRDVSGIARKIKGKPYTKIITIGRPMNIANLNGYGNFDISHFVVYFRSVTEMEMENFPQSSLKSGNEKELNCCTRKEGDECYKNPCLKHSCLTIEKEYTDCICLGLKHEKCPAFPSTTAASTTTVVTTTTEEIWDDCDMVDKNALSFTGCGNTLQDGGIPFCKQEVCFYGVCGNTNGIKQCRCPANCPVEEKPICGSNGISYSNLCVMRLDACKSRTEIVFKKDGFCSGAIQNASHYWPFDNWTSDGKTIDKIGHAPTELHNLNEGSNSKHPQLGGVLQLDGHDDWIDIKKVKDNCISRLQCPNGLSVGFWIKFEGGDYIITAGGYAGIPPGPPGFRLQRDKKRNFFKLEVATTTRIWTLYINNIPKSWLYFAFTWNESHGLKLYFNGKLQLETNKPINLPKSKRNKKITDSNTINLARKDTVRALPNNGKFSIAHLAIWKKSLSKEELQTAYAAKVKIDRRQFTNCRKIKIDKSVREHCGRKKYSKEWAKIVSSESICPDVDIMEMNRKCGEEQNSNVNGCADAIDETKCNILVTQQVGYCNMDSAQKTCAASCGLCGNKPSSAASLFSPKNHFSQETLIFSLLGLFGGLILLLGATVYFWKIYRTRYHGAFVPPLKTVSLLDVSDYEEDKWPNKYIDTSAFFIKDVPPKKRALPLIPARITQVGSGHRYQPPDYD